MKLDGIQALAVRPLAPPRDEDQRHVARGRHGPTSAASAASRTSCSRALDKAVSKGVSNPLVLNQLIDAAVDNLTIDKGLDIWSLANRLRTLQGAQIASYTIPAEGKFIKGNAVLIMNDKQAPRSSTTSGEARPCRPTRRRASPAPPPAPRPPPRRPPRRPVHALSRRPPPAGRSARSRAPTSSAADASWLQPPGCGMMASGRTGLQDGTDEGPRPRRRRRHAPAPDHPHERQAARAGGQQADPVLRPRGDGRGRHPARSASSSATPAPRSWPRSATARGSAWRSPTSPRTRRSGLAHCVLIADEFLGDDDFVMYLGDNLLEQDLAGFVAEFRARPRRASRHRPAAQILLKRGARPAALRRRRARRRRQRRAPGREAGRPADQTWPSSASTCSTGTSTTPCGPSSPSGRGELEITDAIQWLIDHGHRVRTRAADRVVDRHRQAHAAARGQPPAAREDRAARRGLGRRGQSTLDGRVVVERRGRGHGLAHPGPGHHRRPAPALVNSFIGPFTAIGHDCEIVNSEIEHSVVMERSRIIDIPRLEDSPDRPGGRGGRAARRARGPCG